MLQARHSVSWITQHWSVHSPNTKVTRAVLISSPIDMYKKKHSFRGNCTPNQKLACFVLYLKIVNTFLKKNVRIL